MELKQWDVENASGPDLFYYMDIYLPSLNKKSKEEGKYAGGQEMCVCIFLLECAR